MEVSRKLLMEKSKGSEKEVKNGDEEGEEMMKRKMRTVNKWVAKNINKYM